MNKRVNIISRRRLFNESFKKRKILHELKSQEILQSLHLLQRLKLQLSSQSSQKLNSLNIFECKSSKRTHAKKSRKHEIANYFRRNAFKVVN